MNAAEIAITNKEGNGTVTVRILPNSIVVYTQHGNTSTSVRIETVEWIALVQATKFFTNILNINPEFDYD